VDERAFEEIVRAESGRVLSALIARSHDLDLAQDAYGEALLAAWEAWPVDGVPDNPGAWLTTVARNRMLDRLRREAQRPRREFAAVRMGGIATVEVEDVDAQAARLRDDPLEDDELQLVFLCCHPALSQEAQIALTLRTVSGLTTPEIARAFLVPESTMSQRILRAKRKIARAGIPFRMPEAAELPSRLAAVLHIVYLVFTEGWNSTGTADVVRADLCAEALRLARLLHRLLPDEPEVAGLLALLLLHDARRGGRAGPHGELVPLVEQDRDRWNRAQVAEGVALIERTLPLGIVGPYQVQAAIAALHAEAPTAAATDWAQILALYDLLERLEPSPLVTLNRAVALAEVEGTEPALRILDTLVSSATLAGNHRLYATRAHLLARAGRFDEASADFARAAAASPSAAERSYLTAREAALRTALASNGT
jgi:RNA polymerase sigma-70 factor, ECF subfamily